MFSFLPLILGSFCNFGCKPNSGISRHVRIFLQMREKGGPEEVGNCFKKTAFAGSSSP